jgi:cytochrome c-type biogenesis protein CcmH/NrfF
MSSTRFFVLAGVFAAVIGLGGGWWAAQPDRSLSQYERLGAEIGCQCGTCPIRPIATCGCAFADGMLSELAGLTDGALDDDEVLTTFVGRYNESIRIKPAGSGFDLVAWVAPMLLLTIGAVGVAAVLYRWVTNEESAAAEAPGEPAVGAALDEVDDAAARALVERDLADMDV